MKKRKLSKKSPPKPTPRGLPTMKRFRELMKGGRSLGNGQTPRSGSSRSKDTPSVAYLISLSDS